VISETRKVTLPPGESTIRFENVSEGMVAVSAIVTGLPGGTIEKNRNADLLSPASLVDGTLGNRVTITRTSRVTGAQVSQDAIVRTRADGGLVLQTEDGFEAVRCSGLPEKLTFDRIPDGLSAKPVFSVDTRDAAGGTYEVQLTYISWGFDWEAHYVASHTGKAADGKERLAMRSWLTLVNDNGQTFPDAQLLVVAGALNIASRFDQLASPPRARGLYLQCYPIGSTAKGSPLSPARPPPPAPPPAPMAYLAEADGIVVTGSRISRRGVGEDGRPVLAGEENLGDLKLYRVPGTVDVAAKSMKQIAFLDRDNVKAAFQYRFACSPWEGGDDTASPLTIWLRTKNDKANGLGMALPMGGVTLFEPSSHGDELIAEPTMQEYAEGRDVELQLGQSPNLFGLCTKNPRQKGNPWIPMYATLTNANPFPVEVRIDLGSPADWNARVKGKGLAVRDGQWSIQQTVKANTSAKIAWEQRSAEGSE